MIERLHLLSTLRGALRRSRVVALIGPRQCGKTTAARWILPSSDPRYFDLEDPTGPRRLEEPMTALAGLRGVVVVDEIQRVPELFPILRVLADRRPLPARFLILGSASPELLRQSSETLAGRLETIVMSGLGVGDLGERRIPRHWLRGGFPPSYLARSTADSFGWRRQFVHTFLERDVPQMGIRTPASALLRFWTMVAHYHGNVWNAAEPARSLGVSQPTIRHYLDLLTSLFMVRQLQPWHANLKKRQVRAPKVYVRDSGVLHQLLGIHSEAELHRHPKSGASWEGYVIEELIKLIEPDEAYFWATHTGAELDLLLIKNGRRHGFEIKRQDAPQVTPSMRIALEDLGLDQLSVIYPGTRAYRAGERIRVLPAAILASGDRRSLLSGSLS